ncbi:polyhydroxyalkanoate synthesis repressor PhaR [Steroidobacter agaridevorans]|nr:polyhydroxyalkanoate synthesis repressor PhaR [Steroidobacter agaridevorans]
MNALETRLASSSELHRGAVMSEPHFDGKQVDGKQENAISQTRDNQPREGQPRVVKKYPNRRLYDTVESRYITLADIRRLVMDKIDFIVIDKKSQDDITRSILLQVIAEQEHAGEPLMSQDFLSQVIRSYGGAMQCLVGSYLEQSLKLLSNQQQQMREHMRGVFGNDAYDSIAALTQQNIERWRSVQDDIFKVMSGAAATARKDQRAEDTETDPRS